MATTATATGPVSNPLPASGLPDAGLHTWEAGDGTPVLVRRIEPSDLDLGREFVDGLSPQTGYQRLLNPRLPGAYSTSFQRAQQGRWRRWRPPMGASRSTP
jgi:hypothetical protein